jgi:Holliday junction resolvase YEN1
VRISASSARTPTDIACERELSHVIPLCRNILDHLGIPHRDAAGEAEAECAALEKAGIADAVLTRDGDAFVFGSRTVLQKCDAEDKTAMVRQFKMSDMERAQPVLRRQDLFLLAMMAGGDYSHGISGCGPNIALEAARQGFGSELELLVKHRPESLRRWRDKLVEELRHNDRNRFSRKWVAVANAIHAQSNFPSPRIAEYYLKPAVSPRLDELQVNWTKATSVAALRQWTEEYFDWRYALHAGKFVRVLALPLLTKRLLAHIASQTDGSFLVNSVTSSKEGGLSPAEQELRVEFQPSKVVDIDISAEVVHEGYRANMKRVFDPNSLVREWIPRWIIEHGAPAAFRQWQARVGDSGRSASKAKRKASVSSPAAVPKRRRGRPPKNLPLGAPSRVSETPFLDGEFDGGNSQEFPAIFDLVRSPATTTQGHGTTSASVTAPRPARGQSEVIDLTSD